MLIHYPDGYESNFGLTIGGLMPLLYEVEIPEELTVSAGIESSVIKPGIYKAFYDVVEKRYTGIVVEIEKQS